MKFVIFVLALICFNAKSIATPPNGFFDVASANQGLQGWSIDPDNTGAAVTIHFYANAPAGQSGSVYIGSTIANVYRSDVGSHGFYWPFPADLTTPCRITVYAYGIDLTGGPNTLLSNSPRLMNYLTASATNYAGVSNITISATSRMGGAITSLTWNGVEFINSTDHGRELQSAINSWATTPHTPECYNPTEAGAASDDPDPGSSGTGTCTSSELLELVGSGNVLHSKNQMAFWGPPFGTTPTCSTGVINTVKTSDIIFTKDVTIGLSGMAHAIKYDVSFFFPSNNPNTNWVQYELLTGYLKYGGFGTSFNTFWRYNQDTETLDNTTFDADGEQIRPVVLASSNGNYAMGVYCPLIPRPANDTAHTDGYGQFNLGPNQNVNTNKWNVVIRRGNVTAGQSPPTTYTVYVCVGTLENVRVTLGQLIATYPNP